jgi:hypothetical protein
MGPRATPRTLAVCACLGTAGCWLTLGLDGKSYTNHASPCGPSSQSLFCADFDESNDLTGDGGFDGQYSSDPALVNTRDLADFYSAPASYSVGMRGHLVDDGSAPAAALKQIITLPTPSVIDVDFDVRVDVDAWSPSLSAVDALQFKLGGAGSNQLVVNWQLDPTVPGGGITLVAGNNGQPYGPFRPPQLRTWTHVNLEVTIGSPSTPPNVTLSMTVDGTQEFGPTPLVWSAAIGSDVELQVGILYLFNDSDPWKIEYDDIQVNGH